MDRPVVVHEVNGVADASYILYKRTVTFAGIDTHMPTAEWTNSI